MQYYRFAPAQRGASTEIINKKNPKKKENE